VGGPTVGLIMIAGFVWGIGALPIPLHSTHVISTSDRRSANLIAPAVRFGMEGDVGDATKKGGRCCMVHLLQNDFCGCIRGYLK